jgi:hypothetical protein
VNSYILGVKEAKFDISQKNIFPLLKFDELVKSLILLAPQAILGFLTLLAKFQEIGPTPSNITNRMV